MAKAEIEEGEVQAPAEPEETIPATPEPETPPSQEPENPQTPAPGEVKPVDVLDPEETGTGIPNNLKVSKTSLGHDPIAMEVITLAKRGGLTVREALEFVEARRGIRTSQPQASQPATPAVPAAPEPTLDEKITAKRREIETAHAALNYDDEAKFRDELVELIADKKVAGLKLELTREREQQTQARTHDEQVTASYSRAVELFPALANGDTEFTAAVNAELARLERIHSPYLSDPEYPEFVASRIAARMGIAPKSAAQTPTPTTPVPSVAKPPVSPQPRATPLSGTPRETQPNQVTDFKARQQKARAEGNLDELRRLAIEEDEAAAKQRRR